MSLEENVEIRLDYDLHIPFGLICSKGILFLEKKD